LRACDITEEAVHLVGVQALPDDRKLALFDVFWC